MKNIIILILTATFLMFTQSCSDSSSPSEPSTNSHPLNGTWLVDVYSYDDYEEEWELAISNIETTFKISGSTVTLKMNVMGNPHTETFSGFKSDGDNFELFSYEGYKNKGKMIGNDQFEMIYYEEDLPSSKLVGLRK